MSRASRLLAASFGLMAIGLGGCGGGGGTSTPPPITIDTAVLHGEIDPAATGAIRVLVDGADAVVSGSQWQKPCPTNGTTTCEADLQIDGTVVERQQLTISY